MAVTLGDLPVDFGLNYFKGQELTLNSRQKGFKYFSEGYLHAVRLVFNENRDEIRISASCHRSQRKSEAPHKLNLDIDMQQKTLALANCTCTAGCSGCCSHLVGLVQALCQWQLMGLTEPPAELSCTSLPKQWGKPRGTKIEAMAVPQMIVVKPKVDRKRKPLCSSLIDNRLIKVQKDDIYHLQSLKGYPISYLTLNQPSRVISTHYGNVPIGSGLCSQAVHYLQKEIVPVDTICADLHLPKAKSIILLEEPYASLLSPGFTIEKAYEIEEKTRDQSLSKDWHFERKGRLTASMFHRVTNRKAPTTEKFVQSILSPPKFSNEATTYGKLTEKKAREEYIMETHCHVHDCGLVVNPMFHFLGASPDGKVCENGNLGILEIKSPHSKRNVDIKAACADPNFCLTTVQGGFKLKETHQYFTQVQGQLMVTGADFCDFVLYTKKSLHVERILPNIDKMKEMLQKLAAFYFTHMENHN